MLANTLLFRSITQDNEVYYVVTKRFDNNEPVYGIEKGYYLGSYSNFYGIRHIITSEDHITTTVVVHIPDSRTFDSHTEALAYLSLLQQGVVDYEKY